MGHPANGHFNNHSNGNPNHNPNGPRNGLGNGVLPNHNGRTIARNNAGAGPTNGHLGNGIIGNGNAGNGRNRMPPPNSGRSPWSYGPGIGGNGYSAPMGSHVGDAVGPRFNSSRRTSGNGSSGGNSRSSNCDEVSSTVGFFSFISAIRMCYLTVPLYFHTVFNDLLFFETHLYVNNILTASLTPSA